jgi:hypothetical protein
LIAMSVLLHVFRDEGTLSWRFRHWEMGLAEQLPP